MARRNRHDPADATGREARDGAPAPGTGPDGAVEPREAEGRREPVPTRGYGDEAAPPKSDAAPPKSKEHASRTAMVWTATVVALIVLVLLIVFISQNQTAVPLRYFAFEGTVSLGLALLAAAVAGGFLVALAGAARIIQLRAVGRRNRRG